MENDLVSCPNCSAPCHTEVTDFVIPELAGRKHTKYVYAGGDHDPLDEFSILIIRTALKESIAKRQRLIYRNAEQAMTIDADIRDLKTVLQKFER